MLLAGGVEGGDYETVLANARRLCELAVRPIVVYGGNSVVADDARDLLVTAGFRVRVTANVYPAVDELDIVPARAVIHDAFEEHITHAPGMERIGEVVNGRILPTPGAVLLAAERLADDLGDLVVVDVGGATTDVHSITDGSPEIGAIQTEPAARSRRTVEGDLGTFVSARARGRHDARGGERPAALPPALPRTDEDIDAALSLPPSPPWPPCSATPAGSRTSTRRPAARPSRAAATSPPAACSSARAARSRACPAAPRCWPMRAPRTAASACCRRTTPRVALDADYILADCGALLAHFDGAAVVALMRASAGL